MFQTIGRRADCAWPSLLHLWVGRTRLTRFVPVGPYLEAQVQSARESKLKFQVQSVRGVTLSSFHTSEVTRTGTVFPGTVRARCYVGFKKRWLFADKFENMTCGARTVPGSPVFGCAGTVPGLSTIWTAAGCWDSDCRRPGQLQGQGQGHLMWAQKRSARP